MEINSDFIRLEQERRQRAERKSGTGDFKSHIAEIDAELKASEERPLVACNRCGKNNCIDLRLPRVERICSDCDKELEQRAAEAKKHADFKERIFKSDLPPSLQLRTFKNFDVNLAVNGKPPTADTIANRTLALNKCKTACHDREKSGIVLVGPPGLGKTHLLSAVVNRLCWNGFTPDFVKAPMLRIKMQEHWSAPAFNKPEHPVLSYSKSRILVMDELTFESAPPEWWSSALNMLIDNLSDNSAKLFLSTNLPRASKNPNEPTLEKYLGERFISRLISMCDFVRMTGDDARLEKRKV